MRSNLLRLVILLTLPSDGFQLIIMGIGVSGFLEAKLLAALLPSLSLW
jgi:multisubunit Na+/H+ antiporter MnhC subunit